MADSLIASLIAFATEEWRETETAGLVASDSP
jgi:hypothetical protein